MLREYDMWFWGVATASNWIIEERLWGEAKIFVFVERFSKWPYDLQREPYSFLSQLSGTTNEELTNILKVFEKK